MNPAFISPWGKECTKWHRHCHGFLRAVPCTQDAIPILLLCPITTIIIIAVGMNRAPKIGHTPG